MSEKDKLTNLYEDKIPQLQKKLAVYSGCGISRPLLISPPAAYLTQKTKMMIVGQQTCGWGPEIEFTDISGLQKEYREFNLGKDYKTTPFWGDCRKLEQKICGNKFCSVWSNINRVDQNGEKPCDMITNVLKEYDILLKEEIRILRPNIVIFFCGHKFDSRIQALYPAMQIKKVSGKFSEDWLAYYEGMVSEIIAIRTYHPKYLRMKEKENEIIEEIVRVVQSK